jgi:hypothetical protein
VRVEECKTRNNMTSIGIAWRVAWQEGFRIGFVVNRLSSYLFPRDTYIVLLLRLLVFDLDSRYDLDDRDKKLYTMIGVTNFLILEVGCQSLKRILLCGRVKTLHLKCHLDSPCYDL